MNDPRKHYTRSNEPREMGHVKKITFKRVLLLCFLLFLGTVGLILFMLS